MDQNQTAPVTTQEWTEYLERYSDRYLSPLSAEQREDQFLTGVTTFLEPPADERLVAELEARIGVALPPGYRNFLLASNGSSAAGDLFRLFPAEDVGWVREIDAELIEAWSDFEEETEFLQRSLFIGSNDADSYYFLDPTVVENGEWAAINWFYKPSEPELHPSFGAFVVDLVSV